MTKAELVEEVSRVSDLTKKHSEVIVDTVFKSIIEALHRGEKIELRGFGSFRLRKREPRKGRNPKTGDKVDVPPKKVPYFKPGKELKELINREAEAAEAAASSGIAAAAASAASASRLMSSFSSLPGLKYGTFFGGTSTLSPVFGLRPLRGSRFRRRKLPNPRSSIFSPRCRASMMLLKTVSTMTSECFLVRSDTRETSSTSSALVMLPAPLPMVT
jgi:integration host factor subunit beta